MSAQDDLQRQVNETFDAFRRSLEDMLAAEAREQVESTLSRLKSQDGAFRVEDIKVDVVIRDLKLASTTSDSAASPTPLAPAPRRAAARRTPKRAPAKRNRAGARGGGKVSVRETLLAAFPDDDSELGTVELKASLERAGVSTSDDNVHQQLRRLVVAGELERAGRGVYRRAAKAA